MDRKCLWKMEKNTKHGTKWNLHCISCLIPSLLGISVFFMLPYFRVLYFSVINNQFQKQFVGFRNYLEVAGNPYFRLAMKNSLLLIIIGVPLLLLLSLVLSFLLSFSMRKYAFLRDLFIFPVLVPTAAVVLVWRDFFPAPDSALPIYALFVWKNLGFCIILLTAALVTIDKEIFEAARLEGAGALRMHLQISTPLILPALFFTLLLAVMNTFKLFKESFLFYEGKYPPDHSYTLQFYMNNNFLKFDYQSLAAACVLTSILVLGLVFVGLLLQRRVQS